MGIRHLAIGLSLCVALSACENGKLIPLVTTEVITPDIPPSLRVCRPLPPMPMRGASNREVSGYIVDLVETAEDCKSKHSAVIQIIDEYERKFKPTNPPAD